MRLPESGTRWDEKLTQVELAMASELADALWSYTSVSWFAAHLESQSSSIPLIVKHRKTGRSSQNCLFSSEDQSHEKNESMLTYKYYQ